MPKPELKEALVPSPTPKGGVLAQRGDSYGLYSNGLVNSQDFNNKLTGVEGVKIFNEMRLSDATVRASTLAVTLPILAARWYIDSDDESRQGKKIKEYVEDVLFNGMNKTWQETLSEILLYLTFGRMPFELVYKFRPDGLIGLKKLMSIWPSTVYKWKIDGDKDGIEQQTVNGRFSIPIDKLVVFVNAKEGDNWEGISILRTAYKHWYIKDKYYIIDAMAMERQGLGVPYAKKPTGGSTPEEEQQMEEALQNLRANEKGFVMFREGWEIGFLDMKSGTIKNPTQMIQHHDRQISKNVLAQFLELGSGNGGSWALSQDQSKLFLLSLEAVANYIADNINKFVIKKLVDFNFPNVENYPKLCFDKIGNVNFSALMVALQQGIQSKIITPDAKLEEYLRDVMDLPEYSGETLVDPAMADTMINELEMSLSDATGENAPTGAEEETPEEDATEPTDAEVQEAYDQIQVWGKTNHVSSIKKAYGDELAEYFKAGVVGQPLSEETKRKISEALKKIRGGGSGSKKKGTNPEVAKRNKEIAGLRKQVKEFSDAARRELLDMRAKGIKLSPEDAAKKQLELFDKRKPIMDKIEKLKDEVSAIKEKSAATPAPAKKAHDHTAEPTDPSLLKMSEDLSHAIKKLTK